MREIILHPGAVLTTAVYVASAGLSAKSEKAAVSPSVMGYGADSTWMPVLQAVTFAAPHVGVRLLCFIWHQHLLRSHVSNRTNNVGTQNAAFVRRMEGRGIRVLRVVNRWDYVPHMPGAFLEPLLSQVIAKTGIIAHPRCLPADRSNARTHGCGNAVAAQNPKIPATPRIAFPAESCAMVSLGCGTSFAVPLWRLVPALYASVLPHDHRVL